MTKEIAVLENVNRGIKQMTVPSACPLFVFADGYWFGNVRGFVRETTATGKWSKDEAGGKTKIISTCSWIIIWMWSRCDAVYNDAIDFKYIYEYISSIFNGNRTIVFPRLWYSATSPLCHPVRWRSDSGCKLRDPLQSVLCSQTAGCKYRPRSWHKSFEWAPLSCTAVPAVPGAHCRRTWDGVLSSRYRADPQPHTPPLPRIRSVWGWKKPIPYRRNRWKMCPSPKPWARRTPSWLCWLERSCWGCTGWWITAVLRGGTASVGWTRTV